MTAPKIKTTILTIIGLILLMLLASLWFAVNTITRIKSDLEIQVHTRTVIIALKDNLTHLLNAETGERGFIITGDTNYLPPYQIDLQNISSSTNELRKLMVDQPAQQQKLDTLEHLIQLKLERIALLLSLKKQGDEKTIQQYLVAPQANSFMDNIRKINNKMQSIEIDRFAERQANTAKSIATANAVFIAEAIFSLLVTLFLAMVIVNELNRRAKAETILRNTNIELQSKNKEIEQFAYVASHDLQEPLRSISNFASLLAPKIKDHPDPRVNEFMQTIVGATKRMSSLIYDLLDYSRIGKDTIKSRIDCNEMIKEVLADMDATIKETKAKITVGKLPMLNGYTYLESIFRNLLSNALKFHKKEQHPVINISATQNSKEYIFTVQDNGIGIEQQFHQRIFLMFQRLHTRTEYAGTGIGLAQCQKIVELHGGKIWVKSELGVGSTFIFTIPK